MEHQKKLYLVPYVILCYHGNQFVRDYSRFSEFHMFPLMKFLKFSKVTSDLIFEISTLRYFEIPNFSQISEEGWELRASEF